MTLKTYEGVEEGLKVLREELICDVSISTHSKGEDNVSLTLRRCWKTEGREE